MKLAFPVAAVGVISNAKIKKNTIFTSAVISTAFNNPLKSFGYYTCHLL
jgi:hypothetical protein